MRTSRVAQAWLLYTRSTMAMRHDFNSILIPNAVGGNLVVNRPERHDEYSGLLRRASPTRAVFAQAKVKPVTLCRRLIVIRVALVVSFRWQNMLLASKHTPGTRQGCPAHVHRLLQVLLPVPQNSRRLDHVNARTTLS
jgi:hypothetical protein